MLHLITVATHDAGYYKWLKMSCLKQGVVLKTLGWGQKWKGYNMKIDLLKDYLEKETNDNDLICFVDAYDVLLLRPLNNIHREYQSICDGKERIIISSEMIGEGLFTRTVSKWLRDGIFGYCDDKRLNSGLILSKSYLLKEALSQFQTKYNNDQMSYTEHCRAHPEYYHMDTQMEIFLTIYDTFHDVTKQSYIKLTEDKLQVNDRRPYFIHANGNGNLVPMIKRLDLEITFEEEWNLWWEHIKIVLFDKIVHYIKIIISFCLNFM